MAGPDTPLTTTRFADVNGVRLHYARAGRGPLIILLHGFPEFWYTWKDVLPELARDHLAVAPDMRGYNLSSKPADVREYRMSTVAADIVALADHLQAKTFVLVGHDWGGLIAWQVAIDYPDRLDKLIVINAPHPAIFARELASNPAQQQASSYIRKFQHPDAESRAFGGGFSAWVTHMLDAQIAGGKGLTDADKAMYTAATSQPGALTGALNYYRAMAHPSQATAPEKIKVRVPTLVIWGELDPYLLTGNLNDLQSVAPNVTIKRVPDGTHWLTHEQPEMIAREIRAFL